MSSGKDRALPPSEDRATRQSPSPTVSALRASIPSAARKLLRWGFPYISTILGSGLILIASEREGWAAMVPFIAGVVLLLGALDAKADRVRAQEQNRWAKLIAGMITDEKRAEIRVEHTYQSLRPELDELVERLVAQAIEARSGLTEGLDPKGESAVPGEDGDAPK